MSNVVGRPDVVMTDTIKVKESVEPKPVDTIKPGKGTKAK